MPGCPPRARPASFILHLPTDQDGPDIEVLDVEDQERPRLTWGRQPWTGCAHTGRDMRVSNVRVPDRLQQSSVEPKHRFVVLCRAAQVVIPHGQPRQHVVVRLRRRKKGTWNGTTNDRKKDRELFCSFHCECMHDNTTTAKTTNCPSVLVHKASEDADAGTGTLSR